MNRAPAQAHAAARATPQPATAGSTPASAILSLQHAAGNRAVGQVVLARSVIADVRTSSVGEAFADQLTPEELNGQVAVLVDALKHGSPAPAEREAIGQNLRFLEGYGAAHGTALPAAAADDFRLAIAEHLDDLSKAVAIVRQLTPKKDFASWGFRSQLGWHVDQLSWITEATGRATQLAGEAEAGGAASAGKFAEAGTELTAAIFGLKAVSILLAHDDLHYEVATHYQGFTSVPRQGMEMAHEWLEPMVAQLRTRQRDAVDAGVAALLSSDAGGGWACDIGGAGGAATATATTVLATAESAAALRRLAAIGAISGPKPVEFLGGRLGSIKAPPKPLQASGRGGPSADPWAPGAGKVPEGAPTEPGARPKLPLPTPAEDAAMRRYADGPRQAARDLRDLPANNAQVGQGRFKDGSRLVVDEPRFLDRDYATADLPHAELEGPRGELLDPQGVEVPERSTSRHLTITDHLGHLKHHFAPARRGR